MAQPFRGTVLAACLRRALPEMRVVEVFPTAVMRILDMYGATEISAARRKTRADSRAERQRRMAHWITGRPSPGRMPQSADPLDALAAALTAVAVVCAASVAVGDDEEGRIVLPDAMLLARALRLPRAGA